MIAVVPIHGVGKVQPLEFIFLASMHTKIASMSSPFRRDAIDNGISIKSNTFHALQSK